MCLCTKCQDRVPASGSVFFFLPTSRLCISFKPKLSLPDIHVPELCLDLVTNFHLLLQFWCSSIWQHILAAAFLFSPLLSSPKKSLLPPLHFFARKSEKKEKLFLFFFSLSHKPGSLISSTLTTRPPPFRSSLLSVFSNKGIFNLWSKISQTFDLFEFWLLTSIPAKLDRIFRRSRKNSYFWIKRLYP